MPTPSSKLQSRTPEEYGEQRYEGWVYLAAGVWCETFRPGRGHPELAVKERRLRCH